MKKFTLIFCLFAALFTTGCAAFNPFSLASPIITGVVMWKDGEATKYYNEETDPMHRSVRAALKDLNLPVTKDEPTKDGGYYIVAGDKDRFKITISNVRPHITKVSIRVNFMGDKPFAELVYKTTDGFVDTIDFDKGRPVKGERFKLFKRNGNN